MPRVVALRAAEFRLYLAMGTICRRCARALSLHVMSDGKRLIDPVRQFLSAPRCAVLSTLGPDGAPRQIVIHYMLGEDHIRLNGHRDRRWVANVRRDPRVALIIHDASDYLHYVSTEVALCSPTRAGTHSPRQ